MIFDIITIFPDAFNDFKNRSIIKRAIEKNLISINTIDLRNYSKLKHKNVDDTLYGGDYGMLMMFPPLYDAILDVKKNNYEKTKIIIFSPKGKTFNQKIAQDFSKLDRLVLIPAHYEGFDDRILGFVDEEISIGDYVLTNGILPAQVVIDCVSRLREDVILEQSHKFDTFSDGLLKYPEYTKPYEYMGYKVPEILVSGNHKKIDEYRQIKKIQNTLKKRPDLIKNKFFDENIIKIIKQIDK